MSGVEGQVLNKQRNIWSRRRESNPHGTKSRQILSLLRLPVPPLRENCIENNMSGEAGKGAVARGSAGGVDAMRMRRHGRLLRDESTFWPKTGRFCFK